MKSIFSIIAIFILVGVAWSQGPAKTNDKIKILSVSAESPVRDGVANDFTIQVEFTLDSAETATIAVGFNGEDPGRFRMVLYKKVSKGTQTLTLKAKATPKDWKERGDFCVNAILSAATENGPIRPYAGTRETIDFEP